METIKCKHPTEQIETRTESIKSLDGFSRLIEPKPYCEKCDCYIPTSETPGLQMVTFWFIRQDKNVRAIMTNSGAINA